MPTDTEKIHAANAGDRIPKSLTWASLPISLEGAKPLNIFGGDCLPRPFFETGH